MIVNGRCRGNGSQLADYLLNSKGNDRAEFLAMYGASSSDQRRALIEMSLTSEISGKSKFGLYHTQLSPRVEEAAEMTPEQKFRAVEIMAERLGMVGHKWFMVEHEKAGRMHLHLVFERYDHDTGNMWKDVDNYDKHMAASRQMEKEFGWQLTHENKNHLDKGIKEHILDFYLESKDGADFVKSMHRAGFEVTQGMDNRPFQIVDQYGKVHDLTRQLAGIKQGEVSKYLNIIRSELRPTAEVSHDRRAAHERSQPEPERSENLREISDSQDIAAAMIRQKKQEVKTEKLPVSIEMKKVLSYSIKYKVQHPPSLPRQAEPQKESQKRSEISREISDSQNVAAAMLQRQKEREAAQNAQRRKEQEIKKQAAEKTQPANDNDPLAKFRFNKEADQLAQFRGNGGNSRPKERGRERGFDDD